MTMPPIQTTFRFYPRVTFSGELGVNNPDGTPVDLSGWTADLVIQREDALPTAEPLFHLTTDDGITIDGPNGVVSFVVDAPGVGVTADTDVTVDRDGEMWPFVLVLTNPNPTPDYAERLAQGFVIASP